MAALKSCWLVLLLLDGPSVAQQVCDTARFPLSSPVNRFEDHGDGTVTDKTSKLMWVRCSVGQTWENGRCAGVAGLYSWPSAQQSAMQVNRDGKLFFNDWRLPHLRELALITERQCKNPRINLTVFPQTPSSSYWTASSRSAEAADGFSFALAFDKEGISYEEKNALLHVRLVRHAR